MARSRAGVRRGPEDRWQSTAYEQRRQRLIAERCFGEILDVGYAQYPNSYLDGSFVTGLDLNAPSRPCGYREQIVGSAMDLPSLLPSRRFDTIVAAEIIEHVEAPYDFLRGLRSALQPDGRLVLSTPNPLGFPVIALELARSHRWFYTTEHLHYLLPRWVERMLDVTGYRLCEVKAVGIWLPVWYIPWSPVWASYQLIYVAKATR